jgi:hypothetical protein
MAFNSILNCVRLRFNRHKNVLEGMLLHTEGFVSRVGKCLL